MAGKRYNVPKRPSRPRKPRDPAEIYHQRYLDRWRGSETKED
jgi:hypothetical protein